MENQAQQRKFILDTRTSNLLPTLLQFISTITFRSELLVYYCEFWNLCSSFPGIYRSINSLEIYLPHSELWQTIQDFEFLFLINYDMGCQFPTTRFYCRFLQGNEFAGSVTLLADHPLSDLYVFSWKLWTQSKPSVFVSVVSTPCIHFQEYWR